MKRLIALLSIAILAIAGFSGTAVAQGMTCADVTFTPTVYERWPDADKACLEIVTRDDGNTYARFEAEVVSQSPSGTYVRYTYNDGTRSPSRQANPPEGFKAHIAGQDVAIGDLDVRQKVNVYLPEAAWAQPEVAAAPPPPPPPPPPAEPEPEPEMPVTAGSMGWLALSGALFLLIGGGLRLARQRF
jgi:hypothetical protein